MASAHQPYSAWPVLDIRRSRERPAVTLDILRGTMKTCFRLRKARPADQDFLLRLYASTRGDIATSDLPLAQKQELINMQFTAQAQHYASYFPNADNLIVMQRRQPIGRLYVDRAMDEIRVVDILLAEQARGKGIGTQLLTSLLDEARIADKPVRLHVLKHDRAMALYQRLGFEIIAEKELHFFMEFSPKLRLLL
jgi:ribosomal protein S18 acetylase RimI-like enzyme